LRIQRVAVVMIVTVLPLLAAGTQAAELKVYASTAVKAALEELGPQFEKATGDKLVFTFGLSAAVKKQIDEGAAFDVVILTLTLTDDLATAGKIDPASRVAIARAGSGVSVPAGSPKPDVSTAEALKRTLLRAKSIGFTGIGVSRAGNEALLAKLGIADQVKPKIKLLNESAPAAVAKGEVEIGLGPMSEVLLVPGVRLAGPFPAGLQSYLVFMPGVSSSKNADAARSLIIFLTAPAAAPVFKAKDMEPGFAHEKMSEISTMTLFLCLAGLALLIFGLSRVSMWMELLSSRSLGSLEDVPEWVTAIATALQTIAVIGTLAVAYREWTTHELASRQAKIDNVLKFYADEPSSVTDSRNYINRLDIILVCEKFVLRELSENVKEKREEISKTICDPEHSIKNEIPSLAVKTAPIRAQLSKVAVCDRVGSLIPLRPGLQNVVAARVGL